MHILYYDDVPKVKHRTPIKTIIFLHESTIEKADSENKKILEQMTMLKILDSVDELKLKLGNPKQYSQYLKNRQFWRTFLSTLPRRKLDNAILRNEYQLIAKLKLIVRGSDRHTDQRVEIIYKA